MAQASPLQRGALQWSAPGAPKASTGSATAQSGQDLVAKAFSQARDAGGNGELRLMIEAANGWLARDLRPRVAINHQRELLWCNVAAERMLKPIYPVWLEGSRMQASATAEESGLEGYLRSLDSTHKRFLVRDPQSLRGVLIKGWASPVGGARVCFLDFVVRELSLRAKDSGMAKEFGLTPAECEVVDCLAEMDAPKEIAARINISVSTVRTHIRHIYAKLGISTQAQLIRTMMAYCAG